MKKHMLYVMVMVYAFTYGQETLGGGLPLSTPQLSPPTPEVAALGKYLDIPMSLSTGTPNISIPIFNIADGELSAAVSLSYHASGIKVTEMASRVGLGWNLNAGGMITREVRGIADDKPEGFINTANTIADYYTQDVNTRTLLFQNAIQNYQDYESDIYHMNFPGGSGKFFFNQSGEIIIHQKSDVKIVALREGAKIAGWEITTPQGIRYTFGVVRGTTQKIVESKETRFNSAGTQLPTGFKFHTTGWYLTQISDYKGNQIDFVYTKGQDQINYWSLTGQSKNLIGNGSSCPLSSASPTTSLTEDIYTPTYLSSIVTRQGSIVFEYNANRIDLKNDKALTGIKRIDKNNKEIDRYVLDQGYFTSPEGLERLLNKGEADQRTKRLYLKTITQQKGAAANKIHRFVYNETHSLPERFSFSQDLWGYYNGVSNSVLYPGIVYYPYASPIEVEGADRFVDEEYAKALLLKEIIYPTGGKTAFVFESNTLSGGEEFFVGTKLETRLIAEAQLGNNPSQPGATFTANFTIPNSINGYYKTEVEIPCDGANNDCPKIQLYKDNTIVNTFPTDNNEGIQYLTSGNYTIKITNGPFQTSNYAQIHFFEKVPVNATSADEAIVGGLRVKEMQFKDYDNTLITTKKYNYQLFDDQRVSSGLSLNPPIFLSYNVPFSGCNRDILSSNAIFPLNGQSGSHVTYRNVTEYTEGKENGKIEYSYSYAPDGRISATNVYSGVANLIVPATDYSHRRGLLTNQKVYRYNASTNDFTMLEETSTGYKRIGEGVGFITTANLRMGKVGGLSEVGYYDNISERYVMSQTQKTSYYPSGEVKTTTQYTYDTGYQGRNMPIKTTMTNSYGQTIITKNYYPDDVTSTTALGEALTTPEYAAINTLKKNASQHRIGMLIQQETHINDVLTATQRTNYANWDGVTLPKVVQAIKGEGTLEDRIEYLEYDAKGHPLEVAQTDGSHTIYIWGYDDSYPIAKIDHASYTDMPGAVTTLINQIKTDTNTEVTTAQEAAIQKLFDDLRAEAYFKDAQITSFTYDPLIGVTSVTDPRGYTMYYQYDDFNRLEYVKDDAGKLISENKYGYKN